MSKNPENDTISIENTAPSFSYVPSHSFFKNTKKSIFLQDKNIYRWYLNLGRGSEITANVYQRKLRLFCEKMNTSPNYLLNLDQNEIRNVILDSIAFAEHRGNAGGTINCTIKAVKSWLRFNNIVITHNFKIKNLNATPTLENECVPSSEELQDLLNITGGRAKIALTLMALTGVRPHVLGNHKGTDGLKIRDFPEIALQDKKVDFQFIPTKIIIRSELSKTRRSYFGFLSEIGCNYLKSYLESRISAGEVLSYDSAIIRVKRGWENCGLRTINAGSQHITTSAIRKIMRDAIRKKYSFRPYNLRAFFDSQLLLAESNGLLTRAYRSFFMGHSGDMEARYTTHKNRLSSKMVEDMRRSYLESSKYLLEIQSRGILEEEKIEMMFHMAKTLGISDDIIIKRKAEIKRAGPPSLEKTIEVLRADLKAEFVVHHIIKYDVKIINKADIIDFVERGYEIHYQLGDDEFVARLNVTPMQVE